MNDPDHSAAPLPASLDPHVDAHTPAPDPTDAVAAEVVATEAPGADDVNDRPRAELADGGAPTSQATLPDPIPHAGLRYTLLRLLMLVAVGGILYVIGLRGWLLAFAAVLVSGIVSLFLFMKQRNDAAVNLEHTVDHWKHRRDQEDAGLAPE
jgi:hypothetical protein